MLSWLIQITILSIILVFLVHHLINFFKSTLTVPKIKDLVNAPAQKYENMLNIINNNNLKLKYDTIDLLPNLDETTSIDTLPSEFINKEHSMKNELKSFLKKQLHTNISETSISMLDSMSNSNLYAEV